MSKISSEERAEIRETIYDLEREYGAEDVAQQFRFVMENDGAFEEVR